MLSSENDDATNKVGSTIWMGSQINVLKVTTKEVKNYKGGKNYRELRPHNLTLQTKMWKINFKPVIGTECWRGGV